MEKKENRGGRRPGAGNPGKKRVEERRVQYPVSVLPSILKKFRAKHGRKWSRILEGFMKENS